MTRLLTYCLWGLAIPLIAATAFPNAASDYIFTTPLRPAHIKGVVMGSPPAYYIPRSEDVDWLNEAIAERRALAGSWDLHSTNTVLRPEFGKWELSETNRFHKWVTAIDAAGVTNVVVGYNLVTNSPPTSGSPSASYAGESGPDFRFIGNADYFWNPAGSADYHLRYLATNAPLVTTAKVYRSTTYTNIYSLAAYTNGWTNATSTITMTMTNGTVSVHTNEWAAWRVFPTEFTYTNVFESTLLDACHAADTFFPGYTNVPPLVRTWCSVPVAISNDYAALRGAVRLADILASPTNAPAKKTVRDYVQGDAYTNDLYESIADILPWHWTNATSSVSTNLDVGDWCDYELWQSHSTRETTVLYKETDSQGHVTIKGKDVTEYTITGQESKQIEDTAVFKTRFTSDVVSNGDAMRVEVEAMYAAVSFHYENRCTTNYEDGVEIYTNVVVRLSGPELDVSGTNAMVKVLINPRAICEAAANAAGAPAPPSSIDGDPGPQRLMSWRISREDFVIIYRTRPTSKLDGW